MWEYLLRKWRVGVKGLSASQVDDQTIAMTVYFSLVNYIKLS